MTVDSESFSVDDALNILQCERRRAVLTHLLERGECVVSLDTLATAVGSRCPDVQTELEVRLHHVDLPKLAAAGLVRYDAGSNRVVCPDTEPVEELFAVVETASRP